MDSAITGDIIPHTWPIQHEPMPCVYASNAPCKTQEMLVWGKLSEPICDWPSATVSRPIEKQYHLSYTLFKSFSRPKNTPCQPSSVDIAKLPVRRCITRRPLPLPRYSTGKRDGYQFVTFSSRCLYDACAMGFAYDYASQLFKSGEGQGH
jgi:hypothetical protein